MQAQQFLLTANHFAIIVSAIVYFISGALWYSPILFGSRWLKLQGKTKEDFQTGGNKLTYLVTFICILVICYATAFLVQVTQTHNFIGAIKVGLLPGVGFCLTTFIINSLYSQRPYKLMLIDSGYHLFGIIISTIILAYWK